MECFPCGAVQGSAFRSIQMRCRNIPARASNSRTFSPPVCPPLSESVVRTQIVLSEPAFRIALPAVGIPSCYSRGGLSMAGYVEPKIESKTNTYTRGVGVMRCDHRSNAVWVGKRPRTGKAFLLPGCVVAFFVAICYGPSVVAQKALSKPLYLDPSQPIDVRVDDLMSRMTLKEKIGQLNLPCAYVDGLGNTIPVKIESAKKFTAGTHTPEIGPGAGFFTLA